MDASKARIAKVLVKSSRTRLQKRRKLNRQTLIDYLVELEVLSLTGRLVDLNNSECNVFLNSLKKRIAIIQRALSTNSKGNQ